MRRTDIARILADPIERRKLMVPAIQALQAREGIETTPEQAAQAYDAVQRERNGLHTGVNERNYVLHIPRPGSDKTFCNRDNAKVNCCVPNPGFSEFGCSESELCRSCLKKIKKEY